MGGASSTERRSTWIVYIKTKISEAQCLSWNQDTRHSTPLRICQVSSSAAEHKSVSNYAISSYSQVVLNSAWKREFLSCLCNSYRKLNYITLVLVAWRDGQGSWFRHGYLQWNRAVGLLPQHALYGPYTPTAHLFLVGAETNSRSF
jgi:hypothetical protein